MNNPFPSLATDERAALRDSIRDHGVIYPIVVDKLGRVIDGHQRENIARELGVHCPRITVDVDRDGSDYLAVALNLFRRHLSKKQRDEAIANLVSAGMSQTQVAKVTGVNQSTVSRAAKAADIMQPHNVTDSKGRKRSPGRPRKETPTPAPAKADTPSDIGGDQVESKSPRRKVPPEVTAIIKWLKTANAHDKEVVIDLERIDQALHEAMMRGGRKAWCFHLSERVK